MGTDPLVVDPLVIDSLRTGADHRWGALEDDRHGWFRSHPELDPEGRLASLPGPRRRYLHQPSRPGRGRLELSREPGRVRHAALLVTPDLSVRDVAERHGERR